MTKLRYVSENLYTLGEYLRNLNVCRNAAIFRVQYKPIYTGRDSCAYYYIIIYTRFREFYYPYKNFYFPFLYDNLEVKLCKEL